MIKMSCVLQKNSKHKINKKKNIENFFLVEEKNE